MAIPDLRHQGNGCTNLMQVYLLPIFPTIHLQDHGARLNNYENLTDRNNLQVNTILPDLRQVLSLVQFQYRC
jgi:hypothetical protein